jgi:hypothetical protein
MTSVAATAGVSSPTASRLETPCRLQADLGAAQEAIVAINAGIAAPNSAVVIG